MGFGVLSCLIVILGMKWGANNWVQNVSSVILKKHEVMSLPRGKDTVLCVFQGTKWYFGLVPVKEASKWGFNQSRS